MSALNVLLTATNPIIPVLENAYAETLLVHMQTPDGKSFHVIPEHASELLQELLTSAVFSDRIKEHVEQLKSGQYDEVDELG